LFYLYWEAHPSDNTNTLSKFNLSSYFKCLKINFKKWWTAWQSCWRSLLIISIIPSTFTGRSESVHFLTFVSYNCWMHNHGTLRQWAPWVPFCEKQVKSSAKSIVSTTDFYDGWFVSCLNWVCCHWAIKMWSARNCSSSNRLMCWCCSIVSSLFPYRFCDMVHWYNPTQSTIFHHLSEVVVSFCSVLQFRTSYNYPRCMQRYGMFLPVCYKELGQQHHICF